MIKVKDVMKKHVVTIDPSTTISTISKIMTNNRIGSVIIMKNQKPVGIVTTDDMVSVIAKNQNPKKIKAWDIEKIKKRPFITASPNDDILSIAKKMIKNGIKRIPVLDKDKLIGIVSDKEILLVSPELIEVLSEKLKARVSNVAEPKQIISGICENCELYSDELKNVGGRWLCPDCR